MNRFAVVALIGFAVLVSGCTDSVQERPENTDQPADNSSSLNENISAAATVTYTDSGFQPSEVTVERGETVVWVNEASNAMWVGSDQHPSHTEYAGSSLREHCSSGDQTSAAFDQCSTGERFSFTFEKPGEWGYHNHRSSLDTGTVVVTEPE